MRTALAGIAALAVATTPLTFSAPAAAATIRYAEPWGTGTACTAALPCSLHTALTGASNGDTIQLSANEYVLTSQLDTPDNVSGLTITGPPAVLSSGADFKAYLIFPAQADGGIPDAQRKIGIFGQNVRFQRLAIVGTANGSALVGAGNNNAGSVFDRVEITNYGTSDTLIGHRSTLSNSVVEQRGAGTSGSAVALNGTILGSSIYSKTGTAILQSDVYMNADCTTVIRNTIAWGGYASLNAQDTDPGHCAATPVTVSYDHSWFAGPQRNTGATVINGGDNLPAAPALFSDPEDYFSSYVLPVGSPAIDAGCTAGCSDHDVYGRARPIGPANDVGALEQSQAPAVTTPLAHTVTASSATVTGSIAPRGAATTYALDFRAQGTPAWSEAGSAALTTELFGTAPMTASLTGLTSATQYEVRVRAVNARGQTTSTTGSFTTGSTPAPAPVPAVTVTRLTTVMTKRKATLVSRVNATAPGTLRQTATTGKGARKTTRCSVTKAISAAGSFTLRCRLGAANRQVLRRKALKLTIVTSLTTTSERVSSQIRRTLPRTR